MEGVEGMTGLEFYRDKRVLVTGHTGFKGSWLCAVLKAAGAHVTGYSLAPDADKPLFESAGIAEGMHSFTGDIRSFEALLSCLRETKPEIIFHLAAQPIVRESYLFPRETFETNIMGTVNLLEAVRLTKGVRSFVNVTTDKVYRNTEKKEGYKEEDALNGWDPYSNSKSCSDLVTQSYRRSFFFEKGPAVSTARAGNVIGGGDHAKDRIIPDCIRAASKNETIILRHPESVRPFQHVLEPLAAYLLLAEEQWEDKELAGAYNVGPGPEDCITTGKLADLFCEAWNRENENPLKAARWESCPDGGPHEASFLMLDSTKIHEVLHFTPKWNIREAVEKTAEFARAELAGENPGGLMNIQIEEYFS